MANGLLSKVRAFIPESVMHTYRTRKYGLQYVRRITNGMISLPVYERIYQEVLLLEDADFLEIGGAAGAGTISIAWAMRDSGKKSNVVVVEKCEGGSRDRYGNRQSNLERYQNNMKMFSVSDRVKLFPHFLTFENGNQVAKLIQTERLSGMMLDADGRIHRDFSLFWDRLVDGGLIIIDDYHETLSKKHPRTYALLYQLKEWGYFEETCIVGDTCFGRKPNSDPKQEIDLEFCQSIVDKIGL